MRGFSRHASRASCRSARASGWLCIPPAGEASTTPATRSGALCATSRHTGPPIELPTRTTRSRSEGVENPEERPGQRRDSQGMTPACAPSIARQVGDQRRRAMCERRGCRKQVAAGDREAVHVHERDRARNLGTPADEDRTPLDLDPELLPAHLGHDAPPDFPTHPRGRRASPAGGENEVVPLIKAACRPGRRSQGR